MKTASAFLLAIALSVGWAEARSADIGGQYDLRPCPEGAVSTTCRCSPNSGRQQLAVLASGVTRPRAYALVVPSSRPGQPGIRAMSSN
jgi:hypothetical protein